MIVISVGIRKSGTTLAFEMAKAVLELNGHPQVRLPDELLEHPDKKVNATEEWSDPKLRKMARATRGTAIVVRTHQRPNKLSIGELFRLIDEGDVRIQVVVRDPRDTILSMIDESARKPHKPKIESVDEGIERIRGTLHRFRRWLAFPSLVLRYEDLAFDPIAGPTAIADHLGVTVDPQAVWDVVKERDTRKNVARPNRHRTEMSAADSARVAAAFPELLAYLEHGDRTWIDRR